MKIQIVRRWAVVAAGVALLCGLPVIASALPVSVPQLTAGQLRARILASADEPYAGYAESNATFGLPPVAGLTGLTSLLNGVTKMRVWQATPGRWRVDVLSDAGERDTYQLSGCRSYIWNSGDQLLTEVRGRQTYRLPRPADLVPPALALRLLSEAGRQARFSVIAPVRVAGRSAAGLRMTPADPASTVGRVDIWADPSSGLPLMVEVFGRGSGRPALESLFFQVSPWHPDPRVLTPDARPGHRVHRNQRRESGRGAEQPGAGGAARRAGRAHPAPGAARVRDDRGLRRRPDDVRRARRPRLGRPPPDPGRGPAGGTPLVIAGGAGGDISTPLLNAVIARPAGFFVTFLLAGTVSTDLLEQAATQLAELVTLS